MGGTPTVGAAPIRFVDLFAGIGGIRIPFDEMGYRCVFSSEWDRAAQATYEANFGERPMGDITKVAEDDIPPHDLLLAGFPCQAFSIMGKMRGFDDTRGTMFFEVARIVRRHNPRAVLLENVKNLVSHDGGRTFEVILRTLGELGYHTKWKVLNALDFGVPQKRERVIIVGFKELAVAEAFSLDFEKVPYSLSGILEPDEVVDRSLFASEAMVRKRAASVAGKKVFYPSVWHENKSGNISVLDHSCALRTGASYNYLLINGVRRPSSRELLRLQGFPDSFRIVVPHAEVRRQTGNSVAVPIKGRGAPDRRRLAQIGARPSTGKKTARRGDATPAAPSVFSPSAPTAPPPAPGPPRGRARPRPPSPPAPGLARRRRAPWPPPPLAAPGCP